MLDAMGVRTAQLYRAGDTNLYFEYLEGTVGIERAVNGALPAELVDSAQGRRLGLADVLTGQFDRNLGNVIIQPDGTIAAIDQGAAFWDFPSRSPFAAYLYSPDGDTLRTDAVSPAELTALRSTLEALRDRFAERGHLDWWNTMMRVYSNLGGPA